MKKRRRVIIDTVKDGEHIYLVPVEDGPTPRYATVEKHVLDELAALECNLVWHVWKDRVVAWKTAFGERAYIDRLIADCQPHRSVFPLDGDFLNLHRNNLAYGYSNVAKRQARHPDHLPKTKLDRHIVEFIQTY